MAGVETNRSPRGVEEKEDGHLVLPDSAGDDTHHEQQQEQAQEQAQEPSDEDDDEPTERTIAVEEILYGMDSFYAMVQPGTCGGI